MSKSKPSVTVIVPAHNEADQIGRLVREIGDSLPLARIIVVNDGSTDGTAEIAAAAGAEVINHPYPRGNGAAIKAGARAASSEIAIFMDGDGQHNPADLPRLLTKLAEGYDMVVGARTMDSHASIWRRVANGLYNRFASLIVGYPIADLTSGMRAVRLAKFRRFLYLLPNGFSYPTTSTMAFFRAGYAVGYLPIRAARRSGQSKSHIRPLHDGVRFLLIIIKIGSLFSPMRLFVPVSGLLFLTGLGYYLWTYLTLERFTNMGMLLFLAALIIFMIGILAEQVAALHYRETEEPSADRPLPPAPADPPSPPLPPQ
jgi:glycosyltransferase involved in cell wall biosynthesis